ncbi:MAG: kinase family, partial [Trebouxia sp. A1-2]
VADGLHFLHSQANLIHRGISPEAICITAGGAWKLAGFGFAMLAEFGNSNPAEAAFDYSDSSNCLAQALRPALSYTAPELVVGAQQSAGGLFSAADIFTLGIVMYEVIGDKKLLNVGQSLYEYRSKISAFQQVDLSAVAYELQSLLGPMLSVTPAARPSAISITGSQYFQGDVMLRALRFMDSMIQRDTMQKAAFLNDLTTFWHKFDDRVLRLKDFADTLAPALMPIFQSAKGDTLLLLVRSTPTLMKSMPRPYVTSMMVPLLLRAAEQGDPRCQDEMLKQLPSVAEQTEYTTLKSELLPRMHTLCLKTTSASVRVNSLTCMGRIVARLDEDEAGKMLQTAGKVSAVDHTAPTVMCVLALGDAISKQYGLAMAAKEVLPLLTPLLVLPALSGPQFSQAMGMVKSILGQIESKRARELEVPDSAPLSAVNTARPSSNPSTLTGGMTSWDTPAMPSQPALGTRSPVSTSRPNSQPAPQPSWQNSKPIAAVRDAPSSAGPRPASTSYQRPKPQAPHPGDQLANVISNDQIDALFMDPSWTDPDLGGPGGGMGMGQGGPPRLAQPSPSSMQSSAAADPFSQLSLSRGSSGECSSGRLLIKMSLL